MVIRLKRNLVLHNNGHLSQGHSHTPESQRFLT